METGGFIKTLALSLVVGLILYIINDFHSKLESLEEKIHKYELGQSHQSIPRTANPCGCGQH